jgi:glycosyl transferase family 87
VLGWRLLHDEPFAARAAWLGPLLPRPSGDLDRDPIALVLAAAAVGLAIVYLFAVLAGARPAARVTLLALAATLLVALPTAAFVAMGAVTGRPYGQDGGVVQLPLAIDHILAGRSPYGADYADSMLGRQARVSDFWSQHGGNPILRHHAYLPGTHLLMMPFAPLSRAVLGVFDPRVVTLLAFAAAGVLVLRLPSDPARGVAAAAAVWVSPLVYWPQIFGANDVLVAVLLLAAVHLARASHRAGAAVLVGLACATKQLAWPFAPFLLAHLSGARTLGELVAAPGRGRLARAAAIASAVFVVVVAPIAALDFRAFWADIVVYNAGLPGADNYPLGGTPGLGFANLLVYFGAVTSLRDYVPLSGLYLLLVPIGVWLLREQLRRGDATGALVTGSAALLLSLYVSRVMHPNYLILAAVLLPAAAAGGAALAPDALIGGLALLATGVEIAEGEVFATTWTDATSAHWPAMSGLASVLAPRAGPALTRDPLGLLLAALACALGIVLVVAGTLRARRSLRMAVLAASVTLLAILPASIVMKVGRLSGHPRVQDAWAATVWPVHEGAPTSLREAWSVSFRKEPPAAVPLEATAPAAPAGRALARLLGSLGVRDPRVLTLLALIAAGVAMARAAPPEKAMVRLAVLVLPPCLLGAVFGSGDLVLVALLAAVALALARGRATAGGLDAGVAAALFPRTVPVTAILWRADGRWTTAAGAAIATFAVLGAAGLAMGGGLAWPRLGTGLGLANLRLYAGAVPGAPDAVGPTLIAALTVAGLLWARRATRDHATLFAVGAALLMGALWLAPSASPDDVASPIALLALAATSRPHERFDSPGVAL